MRNMRVLLPALLSFLSLPSAAQEHVHPAGRAERLGAVHFSTSCSARAQPQFDRAVSLLHSFEFGPAMDAFDETLKLDPSCAMAQWGIALSRWSESVRVSACVRRRR